VPAEIGRYHIEGEIARGGVGVVLRAHDDRFGRSLAVKVLQARYRGQASVARRFLEEAQVLGQLQHPGIPPVHDLGELPDGRPFFAMKLIKGQTLTQLLYDNTNVSQPASRDLPRFLVLFEQVCRTVAYAHSRGILHRDLKPSNVMVGAFGEVQVMDWGLAKVLASGGRQPPEESGLQSEDPSTIATVRTADDELATDVGVVLGTPAYMAPEQARGEIDRIDERADVFGLGALLCVILTGQPPYVGPSTVEVYRLAKDGAVKDAHGRLEACGADAELVRLVQACLAAQRDERPRHAGVVADSVAAYQARVQERLRQAELRQAQAQVQVAEERKRRRLTLALAGTVLLLMLGAGAANWWQQRQQAELDKAQALRRSETQNSVEVALQEALGHEERGRTLLDNTASWQATLAAAQAALQRAEALLARVPELTHEALGQRVRQLRARLDSEAKDHRLWTAFEQVRFKLYDFDARYDDRDAYAEVRGALAKWGLPLGEMPSGQAKALLEQRPRPMQDRLAALLHFCLSRAGAEQKEQRQWLSEVLAAADPDPWRQQVRQAVTQADAALLTRLVDQVDVSQLPLGLVEVAREPLLPKPQAGIRLLRRAQQRHPGDFWLNFELAGALLRGVFPSGTVARAAQGEERAVVSEAVGFARVAIGLRPDSAPACTNLGVMLLVQGDVAGAIACYRQALDRDPELAPAHNNLGWALKARGDEAEAMACFRKSLDLDPKLAGAHVGLGAVLSKQGDKKGAIACYKKALELDPNYAVAHGRLGWALHEQGDRKGALACYHKALELDPKLAPAHNDLGWALYKQGDVKGALACYQKALDLDPKLARAHNNLGWAFYQQGDLKGALTCYHKALELDPKLAHAHNNLGVLRRAQGDVKGAIACYHKALQFDPKLAWAHFNLGNALSAQGDLAGAIASYTKALQFDPKEARTHYGIGYALYRQGDLPGAIDHYHKALDLDPKYAEAHCNLGLALRAQGHFAQALESLKRGHELGSQRPNWRHPSAQWVEECQRLLDLDTRLPALFKGEEQPRDATELTEFARLCTLKKLNVAAARFYEQAFSLKPELAEDLKAAHRYHAAAAAARAGGGQGEDAGKLDERERSRWRQQARRWLRADLVLRGQQIDGKDPKAQAAAQSALQYWQRDPALAGVRDEKALAQLPEAEHAAWQQLWTEVTALLKKTQKSTR
jgi:serine/threonine-protein kinase